MKTITAIASTTHIDRHNERMAKSALDGGAEQICDHYIRFLYDHDPNKELGVILAGKVLPMDDGEWALAIVAGFFETTAEKEKFKYGEKNTVWKEYISQIDEMEVPIKAQKREANPAVYHEETIADLLEKHLDSTSVWPDGRVLKIKRFIASIGDLEIHVYPKDHDPPHFHIISVQRGIDARYSIDTLELINHKEGQILSKDDRKIRNFFETSPDVLKKLHDEFKRLQS